MAYAAPPPARPEDRRRAARLQPGPLRVRVHRFCEGILVDISEVGALVQLPSSQPPNKQVTLHVDVADGTLEIPARVVRSTPCRVQLASATLARTEYKVALDFSEVRERVAAILQRIVVI